MKEKRIINQQEYTARALTDDQGRKVISGYASVFNQRSKLLFENGKTFYEVILPGCFDDVLASEELDVLATYQHDLGSPLARLNKRKGIQTLTLETDEKGLRYTAILNNTTVANDTWERVKSGDVFESSFIFTVSKDNQRWTVEDGQNVRYISKVSGLYDCSIVVSGAYENTDIAAAERSFQEHQEAEQQDPTPEVETPSDTYFDNFKIQILEL